LAFHPAPVLVHTGQERAPALFRQERLVERLRSSRIEVIDLGDLPKVAFRPDPRNPKCQNLEQVRDVALRVAEAVSWAAQARAKPLVLGGDCTITLGVLSGLLRHLPDLGLMYVDGDVDLNTPADTPSGILDGMGMAHIIGKGADALTRLGPRYPLMPQEDIVLFGYNADAGSIDASELEHLKNCSMVRYAAKQIRDDVPGVSREALERLESRVACVLVHFDVDVIDYADFPVADVPHRNGLTFSQALAALRVFVSSPRFAGLVITEFNADRSAAGIHAERLVAAVTEALRVDAQD
jgi:arginase